MSIAANTNTETGEDAFTARPEARGDMLALLKPPEFWVEMAEKFFPASRNLTAWFPYDVEPSRIGWYERFFVDSTERQYWDGVRWLWNGRDAYRMNPEKPFRPCWRGLNRPISDLRVKTLPRLA